MINNGKMRPDRKTLQGLQGKAKEFYKVYGFKPTPKQLEKFSPPKNIKLGSIRDELTKKVPSDTNSWERQTWKKLNV